MFLVSLDKLRYLYKIKNLYKESWGQGDGSLHKVLSAEA